MYIWKVDQTVGESLVGQASIPRYILTSSKQADDAIYRLKEAYQTELESLNEVQYIGWIPSLSETYASPTGRPKIFYIKASYSMSGDSQMPNDTKRLVTSFFERIDNKLAQQLGVTDPIGPMPTGPNDALDVAIIGLILAIPDDTPESARMIMQSHVFSGSVKERDINIMTMKRIRANVV